MPSTSFRVKSFNFQTKFLDKIHREASILDFGCGSGRDTKYFLEQGYTVEAIDGSEELCKLADDYTGIEVKHMLFQDLQEFGKYDAICACSSILHLPYTDLVDEMKKMVIALKDNGLIYTSFKYGTFEGVRNGRYFIDMKEKGMSKGEFISVAQANGGIENMINQDCKDKDLLALIKYIAEEDKLEKILENPQVIKTPVVRNGKQSTLGYMPDVWKGWN